VSDSPDRGERKRHGRFSLSRARDRSEETGIFCTVLPSPAGRLFDSQDVRMLFGGESAQDNESHSGLRRPVTQSGRDRALEFRSRNNAKRILNRKDWLEACTTSPSIILSKVAQPQCEPRSTRRGV